MNSFQAYILKDIVTKHFAASELICSCPCWILSFLVSCDSSTPGKIVLRNGFDSNADIFLRTVVTQTENKTATFDPAIYLSKGIYVQFIGAIYGFTLQYVPES